MQASHVHAEEPCTSEATISMSADTKKMHTWSWKYTIITPAMSRRLIAGGASEGCRAKLPRWSFSRSSCTYASGTALDRSMVGSHTQRVKLFCAAPRIFGAPRAEILVVAVPLPASFLALSPEGPPLTALSVSGSAPRLEDTAATCGEEERAKREKRFLRTYSRFNCRISRSMGAPSMPAKSFRRVFRYSS